MIKKIKRFLLRQPNISFYKKNESGSEYYKIKDCLIRLSDHRASAPSPAQNLDIIVNDDMFVVFWLGQLENVRTYDELKQRIKDYIRDSEKISRYIGGYLASMRSKMKQEKVVEKVVEKIVYVEKVPTTNITTNSNLPVIDEESKTIEYLGYRVNCSPLKEKSWSNLKIILTTHAPKDVQKFTNVLKTFSLKKEKI